MSRSGSRAPSGPAIRVERMDLKGIDFDWPKHATALKAASWRPRVDVEREADGSINLRRLFTVPESQGTTPTPEPAPKPGGPPAGPKPKGVLEAMRLESRDVRIDDGFIRFVDRTTTPACSEDLSRLEVRLTDLGNRPRERARLALQGVWCPPLGHPVDEPSAGKPHARISEGESRMAELLDRRRFPSSRRILAQGRTVSSVTWGSGGAAARGLLESAGDAVADRTSTRVGIRRLVFANRFVGNANMIPVLAGSVALLQTADGTWASP